jgi:hypothetical protein
MGKIRAVVIVCSLHSKNERGRGVTITLPHTSKRSLEGTWEPLADLFGHPWEPMDPMISLSQWFVFQYSIPNAANVDSILLGRKTAYRTV